MKKIPGLGMRTVKTAIAVVCSYIVVVLLNRVIAVLSLSIDTLGALYACIAAVICMQPSVKTSIKSGVSRLIGTLVGGVFGCLVLLIGISRQENWLILVDSLKIILGVIACIATCNIIKHAESSAISVVVFLIIALSASISHSSPYLYTLFRMAETVIGIVVSVIVNLLGNRQNQKIIWNKVRGLLQKKEASS